MEPRREFCRLGPRLEAGVTLPLVRLALLSEAAASVSVAAALSVSEGSPLAAALRAACSAASSRSTPPGPDRCATRSRSSWWSPAT